MTGNCRVLFMARTLSAQALRVALARDTRSVKLATLLAARGISVRPVCASMWIRLLRS